ncbi:MAG: UDP-glucose 4-epimerase GalE [Mariprofundales bacterium]|nr:UDP-glucose 4-epimerase GalE [Mariprofundales bacterium]
MALCSPGYGSAGLQSMKATVMITGGAGYIGSHIALLLRRSGYSVVVFDNLSSGNGWAVAKDSLVLGDILDTPFLVEMMKAHQVKTVIHLAAKSNVMESFLQPDDYFVINVQGTRSVLDAAVAADVRQIVFSSSAAVYGDAVCGMVREDSALHPLSPYGQSKLDAERLVVDRCVGCGIGHVIFRYFNVLGGYPSAGIGQCNLASNHLMHKCIQSAHDGSTLSIYGHDYATEDGTAVRDYIHVRDLAALHGCALRHLERGGGSMLVNAGYGRGYSVLAFMRTFQMVTGVAICHRFCPPRQGDPAALVADVGRLRENFDWIPEHAAVEKMIGDSWEWEHSAARQAWISGASQESARETPN